MRGECIMCSDTLPGSANARCHRPRTMLPLPGVASSKCQLDQAALGRHVITACDSNGSHPASFVSVAIVVCLSATHYHLIVRELCPTMIMPCRHARQYCSRHVRHLERAAKMHRLLASIVRHDHLMQMLLTFTHKPSSLFGCQTLRHSQAE